MVLPPRRGDRLPYFTALIWGRTKFTFSAASTGYRKACLGFSCPIGQDYLLSSLALVKRPEPPPPLPKRLYTGRYNEPKELPRPAFYA